MKAIEQYFHVAPFIMLFKVVSSLSCCSKWCYLLSLLRKPKCVTIQVKAIWQYFHVVLFSIYTVQGGPNFNVSGTYMYFCV